MLMICWKQGDHSLTHTVIPEFYRQLSLFCVVEVDRFWFTRDVLVF